MFGRNIDFFAVLFIAVGLIVSSKAASFGFVPGRAPIHLENAVNSSVLHLKTEILSQFPCIRNR